MTRRRRGLGGWLSRLKTWHQVMVFLIATAGLGSVLTTAAGSFERQYGIWARHFGFARTVDVTVAFEDLKQWQLYSDLRRIKRALYDLGQPTTDRERERFEDLSNQLVEIQAEYNRLRHKKAPP